MRLFIVINQKWKKEFAGFTLNELEVIEHIGKIPDPNVTKLANASYMTRGAISKLTKTDS